MYCFPHAGESRGGCLENPQLLQRLECFRHGNQNNTSFVDLGMTLASCKLSLSLAHVRFVFAVAVCNQQFGCLLFQHVFLG
jgi:hypothetical protein